MADSNKSENTTEDRRSLPPGLSFRGRHVIVTETYLVAGTHFLDLADLETIELDVRPSSKSDKLSQYTLIARTREGSSIVLWHTEGTEVDPGMQKDFDAASMALAASKAVRAGRASVRPIRPPVLTLEDMFAGFKAMANEVDQRKSRQCKSRRNG
jgi:hypothetical protein